MIPSELNEDSEQFRSSLQAASIQCANRCYQGQVYVAKDTKTFKKSQFVVCSIRTLEIHGPKKSFKKTEWIKQIIDLLNVYSLTIKEHPKLTTCIVLVTPDQTVFLRAADRNATLLWYSIIFNSVYTCRSFNPEKSMPRDHYPEYTWDMKVLGSSKYSVAHYSNSNNITDKEPELAGRKRVCLYRNSLAFVHLNEEPMDIYDFVDWNVQYVKRPQYYLISRSNITYYGNRNKHFIFCIREMNGEKAKEVVLDAESEREAEEIKLALEELIQRETKLLGLISPKKSLYESVNSPETSINHNERASTSQSTSLPRDQLDDEMRNNQKGKQRKADYRFKDLFGSWKKKFGKSKENNSLLFESGMNPVTEWVENRASIISGENGTEESGGTLRAEDHQTTRPKDKMRYQKDGEAHEMTSFFDTMNSSISSKTSSVVRPSTSSTSALDSCISNLSCDLSTLSSNAHTTDDRSHRRKYHPIPAFDNIRKGDEHSENLQMSISGSFDSCYSSITNKRHKNTKKTVDLDLSEGPRMASRPPEFVKQSKNEFDVFRFLTGTLSRSMDNVKDLLPEHRTSALYRKSSLNCLNNDDLKRMEKEMNKWLAMAPKPKKRKTKRRKRIQSHDDSYSKTSPVPSSRHLSISSQSTQRSNASRKGLHSARSHSRQFMDNSMEESVHSFESDMQSRANSMDSQRSFVIGAFRGSNKHLIPKATMEDTDVRKYDFEAQHIVRAEPLFYEVRDDLQRFANKRDRRHTKPDSLQGVRGSISFHSGCQVIDEEINYTLAQPKQTNPITGIIG
ncbi:unnamed protein product [Bursaphelenchus xylophilus]|uniref:(pine wood nematode) hypothetical protein n=1 Tax=Bursaphelenchus xylophilus TaxID=6326 RepID=A0A1I7SDC0_BURXY|nr:unnamed protein product [Bursaphelenchus xylophilus]CAG9130589.1 unnamed protein product [Bursaphelenchus xylophilus]